MEELARLARTAGLEVVGSVTQKLSRPVAASYVGSGKVAEIRDARDELAYDVVIADEELSPGQQRRLEDAVGVKVLDRTALILDIFARRARTHEGRLQVEVALLEYRLPRLTRMWTHLSRQAVGGVGLRGPGETQLEVDRRAARARIAHLKAQLAEIHTHRELYRSRRRDRAIPVIALVGYTNAGKSSLLNALAGAGALAEDKLFATLDPTTRRVRLPNGREVLLTDTVGFINRLPTTLVDAFRSTLEEIREADLILHVVDIAHGSAREQAVTVRAVLRDLGVLDTPAVAVLNKIDLLAPDQHPLTLARDLDLPSARVPVATTARRGLDALLKQLEESLERLLVPTTVLIPYNRHDLVQVFQREGQVSTVDFREDGTAIVGQLPARLRERFRAFTVSRRQLAANA